MSNENLFGRDLDEFAMAMDRRSLKEQVISLLTRLFGPKQVVDNTATKEEGQVEELIGREPRLL
jgi:hypothetical protein